MAKGGMSSSLLGDSNTVIKLGIGVLIGIAVIQTIQNTGLVSNTTGAAFQTALALFGTFVTIFVVFAVAKPLLKGFGK